LILEILRLKTQSRLIWGDYDIGKIPTPDRDAIIDDAIAFQAWADNEKRNDPTFGVRDVQTFVNSTLIALKRYLMIGCGIIEFNKFKVIGLYLANDPPMVNDEAFEFIRRSLRDNDAKISAERLTELIAWHDEMYTVINNLVLYNR